MRQATERLVKLALLACAAVGCANTTSPSTDDILLHRSIWSAQRLTNYSFDYQFRAQVYSPDCQTAQWLLAVRADTVASVKCVATTQQVSGPRVTIDSLFEHALRAVRDGRLSAISFDPRLGYPLEIDFAGQNDAAYSERVTGFGP